MATTLDRPGLAAPTGAAPGIRPGDSGGAARLATRFHYLTLLLAYPALLWLGRSMWFRLDEWHIVLGNARGTQLSDLFAPFDIHWSTLPVLYFRLVGAFAGAGGYLQYMGFTLAVYVLDAHMAWRVLRRCGVDPWVSALSAAALLVLGAGWESMYWVLMVAYTLPVAFILGAVLLADRDDLRRRHVAGIVALTLLAEMCIGTGMALMIVPAIVVGLRRGFRQGLAIMAPAALVYVVWLEVAGRAILEHPGGASWQMRGQVAHFIWDGLSGTMASLAGTAVLGSVALVALAVWMAVRWRRRGMPPAVPACAAGAVVSYVLIAVGRANGGVAITPHYVATTAALLLPAMALAVTDLLAMLRRLAPVRLRGAAGLAVAAGLLAVIAHSASDLVGATSAASAMGQSSRTMLMTVAALSAREVSLPDAYPENQLAWAVSAGDIARMRNDAELPLPATLDPAYVAEARLRMRVAVSAQPLGGGPAPVISAAAGATLRVDGGCTVATGAGPDPFSVAARFDGPGSLRIDPVTPEELVTYLRGPLTAPTDVSRPLLLMPPGYTRYLDVIQPGATVILRFSPGSVRLCPAA